MNRMATAKPTNRSSTVPICIAIPYLMVSVKRCATECNGLVTDKDGFTAQQPIHLYLNPQALPAILLPGLSALRSLYRYRPFAGCACLARVMHGVEPAHRRRG